MVSPQCPWVVVQENTPSPHILTEKQRNDRVEALCELLEVSDEASRDDIKFLVTGDESFRKTLDHQKASMQLITLQNNDSCLLESTQFPRHRGCSLW